MKLNMPAFFFPRFRVMLSMAWEREESALALVVPVERTFEQR